MAETNDRNSEQAGGGGAEAKVGNGKGKSVYIYSGNVFTVVQYNTV